MEDVTPLLAAELLKLAEAKRPYNQCQIARFVRDMVRGDWNEDSSIIDPVIVSDRRTVSNGKMRLASVVAARTTVKMAVSWEGDERLSVSRWDEHYQNWPGRLNFLESRVAFEVATEEEIAERDWLIEGHESGIVKTWTRCPPRPV